MLLSFLIPGFADAFLFQQKDNEMEPENIDLVFHIIATVTYSAWKNYSITIFVCWSSIGSRRGRFFYIVINCRSEENSNPIISCGIEEGPILGSPTQLVDVRAKKQRKQWRLYLYPSSRNNLYRLCYKESS